MTVTYSKVFGAIGWLAAFALTAFLVLDLGTPGHATMGPGLSILVIVVAAICVGLFSAIGGAIDAKRSKRVRPSEPK